METKIDQRFRDLVIDSVGEEIYDCYQCGKCSAGCPVAFAMDLLPHQVVRAVVFGRRDKVLASRTIWLCATCETCSTRCPNRIDIAKVMDVLRQLQQESSKTAGVPRVPVFHQAFLDTIKKTGRIHELSMIRQYSLRSGDLREKLKTGEWKDDAKLALKMFLRGKLKIKAQGCKGVKEVRTIFDQAKEHTKS